jgi:hypothetical protein
MVRMKPECQRGVLPGPEAVAPSTGVVRRKNIVTCEIKPEALRVVSHFDPRFAGSFRHRRPSWRQSLKQQRVRKAALPCLVLVLATLAGCGDQDANREWDLLCKQIDCARYPLGYDSIALAASYVDPNDLKEVDFYFPVSENFRLFPRWAEYGPKRHRLRSLELRSNVSGIGWKFMPDALQRSGTLGDWPSDLSPHFTLSIFASDGPESRSWIGNWRVDMKLNSYSEDEIQRITKELAVLADVETVNGRYDSLSENFWLIYKLPQADGLSQRKSAGAQLRFGVFSKAPMLQDMHILGICNQRSCMFYTLPEKGKNNSDYLYQVSWYFENDISMTSMIPDAAETEFPSRGLEKAFAVLSRVIDASRRKPGR